VRHYLIRTVLSSILLVHCGCGLQLGPGELSESEIKGMLEGQLQDGARIEQLELLSRKAEDSGEYTYKVQATIGGTASGSLTGRVTCKRTDAQITWRSSLSRKYK
jgi:hypothetical protein